MTTTIAQIKKCIAISILAPWANLSVDAQSNKPVSNATIPTATEVVFTPNEYQQNIAINNILVYTPLKPVSDLQEISASQAEPYTLGYAQYLDGLGRPIQSVLKQASPTGNDIVYPKHYNEFGLKPYSFMPYTSNTNDGSFQNDPFNDQKAMLSSLYSGDDFFYSKTEFENSPFKRTEKVLPQGKSWVGKNTGTSLKYGYNSASENIRIWDIGISSSLDNNIPISNSTYSDGELSRFISIKENGNAEIQYIDKEGKLILKKVQIKELPSNDPYSGYDAWLSTYFVYDNFNRLRFVISPKAVNTLLSQTNVTWDLTESTNLIEDLCFHYEYDYLGRLRAAKEPGKDWRYLVYDNHDRLVFAQDGNLRESRRWLVYLYDELNRPVISGIMTYPETGTGYGTLSNFFDLQNHVEENVVYGQTQNLPFNPLLPQSVNANITLNTNFNSVRHIRASNSITFDPGFSTGSNVDLTAEIITTTTTTPSSESISVSANPVPPSHNVIPLKIMYYDEYDFKNKSAVTFTYSSTHNNKLDAGNNLYEEALPTQSEQMKFTTRGKITGSRILVIANPNNLATGTWSTNAVFYDFKNRIIQLQEENFKGGTSSSTILYDYSGKVLSSYSVHNNPQNTDPDLQSIPVKTSFLYDRIGRVLEIKKQFNDDVSTERIIQRNEYDALGKLLVKKIGGTPGSLANDPNNIDDYLADYDKDAIESQSFDYNIRGWLKGINRDYANGQSESNWFGMEISFDFGFEKNQLTGTPSGVKWRSAGDGEQRAYGFDYDRMNRLQFADFSQKSGSSYIDDPVINFDMQIGELINGEWKNAYDENGNILKLKQWGTKLNLSAVVDDLTYTYLDNSNKLKNVIDASNDHSTLLGDFRSSQSYMTSLGNNKTNSAVDYDFDANGNIIKDLNRDIDDASIQAIQFNHMNLPYKITVKDKGVITYIYDANGVKLEKIVTDNTNPTPGSSSLIKKTTYLNGFVYQDDELQYFMHEGGRVRVSPKPNQQRPQEYKFDVDYFIADHLGNTRVILTDEEVQVKFPMASLEPSKLLFEKEFYGIQDAQIVDIAAVPGLLNYISTNNIDYINDNGIGNTPHDPAFSALNSEKLYKLNSNTVKTGLGITLKIMAGDKIDVFGKSYYQQNNPGSSYNNHIVALDLLTAFLNAPTASASTGKHGALLPGQINTTPGIAGISNMMSQQNNEQNTSPLKPRAFINVLFFDEQFRVVDFKISMVGNSGELKEDHFSDLQNLTAIKSGYVYIYCSNESPVDVFFDNLQVVHTKGPLVETNEYYPFGLLAAGISYKAFGDMENYLKLSGNELQSGEFESGTGLELYDFNARMYDAQIGRFQSPDPLASLMPEWSGYSYSYNNPAVFTDKFGLMPDCCPDEDHPFAERLPDIEYEGEMIKGAFEFNVTVYSDGYINRFWDDGEDEDCNCLADLGLGWANEASSKEAVYWNELREAYQHSRFEGYDRDAIQKKWHVYGVTDHNINKFERYYQAQVGFRTASTVTAGVIVASPVIAEGWLSYLIVGKGTLAFRGGTGLFDALFQATSTNTVNPFQSLGSMLGPLTAAFGTQFSFNWQEWKIDPNFNQNTFVTNFAANIIGGNVAGGLSSSNDAMGLIGGFASGIPGIWSSTIK